MCRDFLMCCDDKEEQKSWMNEIKAVISRPLDSKDSEGTIAVAPGSQGEKDFSFPPPRLAF